MKSFAYACLLVGSSSSLLAAPDMSVTPYGLLNKELRMTLQDDKVTGKGKAPVVTDVDGYESRIGIKGSGKSDNVEISYKAELGVNSAQDGAKSRIRIRLMNVGLKTSFGKFVLGQDWAVSSINMIKSDPFSGTFAQNYNLDNSYVAGSLPFSTLSGTGYHLRAFHDMLRYESPSVAGVKLTFGMETDGPNSFDKNNARYHELNLVYENEEKTMKAFFYQATCESCNSKDNKPSMGFGANVKVAGAKLALLYGSQDIGKAADKTRKIDRLFFGATYGVCDHLDAMLSFGQASVGDYDLAVTSGTGETAVSKNYKKGSQTATALGVKLALNKQVSLRGTYQMMAVKAEENIVSDKKENSANTLAFGTTVSF